MEQVSLGLERMRAQSTLSLEILSIKRMPILLPVILSESLRTVDELVLHYGVKSARVHSAVSLKMDTVPVFCRTLLLMGNGFVTGAYNNGQSQILGQVALARFNDPTGVDE